MLPTSGCQASQFGGRAEERTAGRRRRRRAASAVIVLVRHMVEQGLEHKGGLEGRVEGVEDELVEMAAEAPAGAPEAVSREEEW